MAYDMRMPIPRTLVFKGILVSSQLRGRRCLYGTLTWAENAFNRSCVARSAKRFETRDFLLNCSKANRHLKMNFVNFNLKTWRVLICPLFCGVWRLCGRWLHIQRQKDSHTLTASRCFSSPRSRCLTALLSLHVLVLSLPHPAGRRGEVSGDTSSKTGTSALQWADRGCEEEDWLDRMCSALTWGSVSHESPLLEDDM